MKNLPRPETKEWVNWLTLENREFYNDNKKRYIWLAPDDVLQNGDIYCAGDGFVIGEDTSVCAGQMAEVVYNYVPRRLVKHEKN